MRIAFVLLLLCPATAMANEALWSLLKEGGQVVLIRHAATTPGAGDPPSMRPDDCSTQRNLSDDGRQHARRIGAQLRKRQIPVEQENRERQVGEMQAMASRAHGHFAGEREEGRFAVAGRLTA